MGEYIYGIKRSRKVKTVNGETVNLSQYLYKPSWEYGEEQEKRYAEPTRRSWERKGERPTFYATGFYIGATVYKAKGIIYSDYADNEPVGNLVKHGRKWAIAYATNHDHIRRLDDAGWNQLTEEQKKRW